MHNACVAVSLLLGSVRRHIWFLAPPCDDSKAAQWFHLIPPDSLSVHWWPPPGSII